MYYWQIKWKSYTESPLLISPGQAEYIEKEWTNQNRRSDQFKIAGETYSYDAINSITQTSQVIKSEQTKMLYAAEQETNDHSPLINEDGEVVTNWYKKYVTMREFNDKYVKEPSLYKLLEKDSAGAWIGIRVVEKKNWTRPEYLVECTEAEATRLWKSLTRFS